MFFLPVSDPPSSLDGDDGPVFGVVFLTDHHLMLQYNGVNRRSIILIGQPLDKIVPVLGDITVSGGFSNTESIVQGLRIDPDEEFGPAVPTLAFLMGNIQPVHFRFIGKSPGVETEFALR